MSEPTLNENNREHERGADAFASDLGRLAPAASGLDRDRLMFLAGERSRARSNQWTGRAWPILTGLLALVVAGESALLIRTRGPRVIERVVVVQEPAAKPPSFRGDFSTAPEDEQSHVARDDFAQNADAAREPSNLGLLAGFFRPGPALARYRHLQELALQLKFDADPGPAPGSTGSAPAGVPLAPGVVPPVLEELRRGDIDKFLPHGEPAWPPSFSL